MSLQTTLPDILPVQAILSMMQRCKDVQLPHFIERILHDRHLVEHPPCQEATLATNLNPKKAQNLLHLSTLKKMKGISVPDNETAGLCHPPLTGDHR